MDIGKGLAEAFIFVAVVVAIVIGGVTWLASKLIYSKNEIVSKELITPDIGLEVKDGNRIDTLYVYKKPKKIVTNGFTKRQRISGEPYTVRHHA